MYDKLTADAKQKSILGYFPCCKDLLIQLLRHFTAYTTVCLDKEKLDNVSPIIVGIMRKEIVDNLGVFDLTEPEALLIIRNCGKILEEHFMIEFTVGVDRSVSKIFKQIFYSSFASVLILIIFLTQDIEEYIRAAHIISI